MQTLLRRLQQLQPPRQLNHEQRRQRLSMVSKHITQCLQRYMQHQAMLAAMAGPSQMANRCVRYMALLRSVLEFVGLMVGRLSDLQLRVFHLQFQHLLRWMSGVSQVDRLRQWIRWKLEEYYMEARSLESQHTQPERVVQSPVEYGKNLDHCQKWIGHVQCEHHAIR